MAIQKVYNGSSWVDVISKTWNGSAWVGALKYWTGSAWEALGVALAISPSTSNVDYFTFLGERCYAYIQYSSSGIEYQNASASSSVMSSSRGNWLDIGDSSDVWIQRTINSGSFITDPGIGRLQLSTTRKWGNSIIGGTLNCNVTFKFYDAASGGNQIGSITIDVKADSV